LREHDLEGLRRDLLQTAARFCDEFVRQRSDDPAVRADQGRTYLMLGYLAEAAATKPEALAHYQKGRTIFEPLTREHPGVPDYRRELARSRDHLGTLHAITGRPDQAREEYLQALAVRRELLQLQPGDAQSQDELARSHHLLAMWYWKAGQRA